jgi:hypothetical protein
MNGPHLDINQIRGIAHSGQLFNCADEDQLKRMVAVISHYDASGQPHMADGIRDAVKSQLERVQGERRHANSIAEINRLHKEQMDETKRMYAESSIDSDKKHVETSAMAKKAIIVAWISLAVSTVVAIASVFVAHLDSTRPAIVGINATEIKNTPAPPQKPQIVLPTPKPTPRNLTPTNAAQKK